MVIVDLGINTAHELGHKNTRIEKTLAKIVLAVPAYGHFCVEHNHGHHSLVATLKILLAQEWARLFTHLQFGKYQALLRAV